MNRRGFTLIELLIGLVLTSVVALSIYQVLVNNQRVHRVQTERIDLNATLRAAVSIIPAELREMNASDTADSDIAAMSAKSGFRSGSISPKCSPRPDSMRLSTSG